MRGTARAASSVLVALALGTACGEGAQGPAPADAARGGPAWFEEVALRSGVDFRHVRGPAGRHWFPEIMGSGVALFDAENDGDLDLYAVQGGDLAGVEPRPNALFANDGGGHFADVSAASGAGDEGYGMGCATGDADGDGDLELYVTNVGPNRLLRNESDGAARFSATGQAEHAGWGTSTAFFDKDGDGDLDLFVVNYVRWSAERELECLDPYGEREYCHPNNYTPAPDALYENDGRGRFDDVSEASGVGASFGNGLGVVCEDFDGDGAVDVYVANDGTANQLWRNDGAGRFVDRALVAGCALNAFGSPEAGMGVAAVDPDGDGDMDLFLTHLRQETNTFYENRGGVFDDRTPQLGLAAPSVEFTGFGLGFADFDLDGRLDLHVANGRVGRWRPWHDPGDGYAEPDQLYRGTPEGFAEILPRGGTARPAIETSRGSALGDLDADGDVDLVVLDNDSALRVLRNVAPRHGRWVSLEVPAIGARVRVRAGERTWWRSVRTAQGYCSASDGRVHVGLGSADEIDEVLVVWPDGERELFGPLEADAQHRLARGTGKEER